MTEPSNNNVKQYPFYMKATVVLFGIVLIVYILHTIGAILVPFGFACLIAILLNPLNNRLEQKLPRIIAALISVTLAILIVGSVLYFLSSQIAHFGASFPLIKEKLKLLADQLLAWLQDHFGITIQRQIDMIKETVNSNKQVVGRTLGAFVGTLSVLFLIPFYTLLFLYYKPLILDFLFRAFSEKNSLRVAEILVQTKTAIQSYVIGLLLESLIVAILNSTALLLIGVQYAILLGVIGGIINMVPYIGGLVAIALPVLMVAISPDDSITTQALVIGAYVVIQFIDNHVLVTRIVSAKVELNALISIFVILLGSALWGVSGMFLAIPFVAVLKIIFDRIEELKPWGKLLGDKVPTVHSGVKWQKRWERIFRRVTADAEEKSEA